MMPQRYIILFHDRSSKTIGKEEAEKIMQFIDEGKTHFRLKGEMYACSGISRIIKMKTSTQNVDDGDFTKKMLELPGKPVTKETILSIKRALK